jgi:hypothetical protein
MVESAMIMTKTLTVYLLYVFRKEAFLASEMSQLTIYLSKNIL